MKRDAPAVFWEIVRENDPAKRRELAEEFLELRQFEEDDGWLDSQSAILGFQSKKAREKMARVRAAKGCPYTRSQYDAAVAKVGTKKEQLARELGVDRKTLTKWGQPSE